MNLGSKCLIICALPTWNLKLAEGLLHWDSNLDSNQQLKVS